SFGRARVRCIRAASHGFPQKFLECLRAIGGATEANPVEVIGAGVGIIIFSSPGAVLLGQAVALRLLDYATPNDHGLVRPEKRKNLRTVGGEDFQVVELVLGQFFLEHLSHSLGNFFRYWHVHKLAEPTKELDRTVLVVDFGGETVVGEAA